MRRHLAGDHHHRDRVHVGGGDAGHGVGDAGPRGDQRDADFLRGARVAVGGVHRALLVAHQHVLHLVLLEQLVVDEQDRAAGIAEYVFDAFFLKAANHDLGSSQRARLDAVHGRAKTFVNHDGNIVLADYNANHGGPSPWHPAASFRRSWRASNGGRSSRPCSPCATRRRRSTSCRTRCCGSPRSTATCRRPSCRCSSTASCRTRCATGSAGRRYARCGPRCSPRSAGGSEDDDRDPLETLEAADGSNLQDSPAGAARANSSA